jgi:hypothetical protein
MPAKPKGGAMVDRLEEPIRREIDVEGESYVLTISNKGLTLVRKGKRKGFELAWKDFVSGEAALAAALNASLKHTRS